MIEFEVEHNLTEHFQHNGEFIAGEPVKVRTGVTHDYTVWVSRENGTVLIAHTTDKQQALDEMQEFMRKASQALYKLEELPDNDN